MAEYVSQDNLSNSMSNTSVEDQSLSAPVGNMLPPPSLHSSQHLPTATEMNIQQPPPINSSQRATAGGGATTTTTVVTTTTQPQIQQQQPPPPSATGAATATTTTTTVVPATQPLPPPPQQHTTTTTNTTAPTATQAARCDALYVDKKGGYNVINLKNVTKPIPQDGEVIVRVVACGLNFDDLIARQGLSSDFPKPPFIMGFECSGYIDQIGRGVDKFAVGDRVLCFHNLGCGTKYLKISSRYVYHIPEQMNLQEAAAFPINYITAYILLFHHAHIKEGDMVLIEMASGGVGIALTQLCKSIKDVTVIGTGSSSKHETMKRHGCDYCIDSLTQNITKEVLRITDGRGVDVIFNPLGGKSIEECYKIILPLGKLIIFGEANKLKGEKKGLKSLGGEKAVKYTDLMKHNTTITGFDLYPLLEESQIFPPIMDALFTMYQDGIIKPRIDCAFHVSRTGDAERYLTERRNIGKVILVWDNDDLVMRSTDLEAEINSN